MGLKQSTLEKTVGPGGGEKHIPGKNDMFYYLHWVNFSYSNCWSPRVMIFSRSPGKGTEETPKHFSICTQLSARNQNETWVGSDIFEYSKHAARV